MKEQYNLHLTFPRRDNPVDREELRILMYETASKSGLEYSQNSDSVVIPGFGEVKVTYHDARKIKKFAGLKVKDSLVARAFDLGDNYNGIRGINSFNDGACSRDSIDQYHMYSPRLKSMRAGIEPKLEDIDKIKDPELHRFVLTMYTLLGYDLLTDTFTPRNSKDKGQKE